MTSQEKHGFTLYHVLFSGLKDKFGSSNFLLTYNGKKAPDLEKLVAARYSGEFTGKLFMDSGAFPAFKKNTDLPIDPYIAYVNEVGQHFDGIAQLDYISRESDGTTAQRQEKSIRLTWERFLYMWERVKPEFRHKLIYIMHEAEHIEPLLERVLTWRDSRGQRVGYLGCGLASPNRLNRERHTETIERMCKKHGYTGKFHAFGVQQLDIIQQSNFITSSDSSSAVRDQMTGSISIEGKQVKIQDDTKEHHRSELTFYQRQAIEQHLKERADEMGIDYELAKTSAAERYLWGCRERDRYFQENYRKKVPKKKKGLL